MSTDQRGSTLIVLLGAAAAFAALAGWAKMAGPAIIRGQPFVIDGDSLRFGGLDVRLKGIDAPELRQTCEIAGKSAECGRGARAELVRLIGGGDVVCQVAGRDRFRRALAFCEAGGASLNAAMVAAGQATAFGDYFAEEAAAKAAKKGLWATTFDLPRDWRRKNPPSRP